MKRDLQNLVEVLWWPLSRVVSTVNLAQPRITWKEGTSAEGLPGSHDHLWGDDRSERTQPPLGGAISRLKELGCMQQLAECVSGQAVSSIFSMVSASVPTSGGVPAWLDSRAIVTRECRLEESFSHLRHFCHGVYHSNRRQRQQLPSY